MKHEKPLSNQNLKNEISALQADEPNETAVDRAVYAMQAPAAQTAKAPKLIWRGVGLAAGIAAVGLGITLTTPNASAAGLKRVSNAVKAQKNRHDRAFRPDKSGNLVMTNEDWIEGDKQAMNMFDADGNKSVLIYDGHLQYISYPHSDASIDDTVASKMPIEDISAYLNIPNGKLVSHTSGTTETYTIDFSGVKYELFIDPTTELPTGREVRDARGNLIEKNEYDYPVDVADSVFAIPAHEPNATHYPNVRTALASRLVKVGQKATVGGVEIDLKAVIVGRHRILALWTGGAMGEYQPGVEMQVEGFTAANVCGRPNAFCLPLEIATSYTAPAPIMAGDLPLRGDGAWVEGLPKSGSVTISFPVWAEDRTRPLVLKNGQKVGFHSKLVGRARFEVTDPLFASDPDTVLWKPAGGDDVAVDTSK